MSGFVLDTTFLVDVLRGDRAALDLMETLEEGSDRVIIPSVVVFELWEGVERSRAPLREEDALEEAMSSHSLAPLDVAHAKSAGRLSGALHRRGARIGDADALIAGTALAEDAVVVTRNARDFERIPELRVRTY